MEYKAKGQSELRLFLGQLSGVFALTLTLVVIAGLVFAELCCVIRARVYRPADLFAQLTELVGITFHLGSSP